MLFALCRTAPNGWDLQGHSTSRGRQDVTTSNRHPEQSARADNSPQAVLQERTQKTRDLKGFVRKYLERYLPPPATEPSPSRLADKEITLSPALRYIRIIPYMLLAIFGASFLWDFDGIILYPLGFELPLEGLLLKISVSGLVGFGTNWLAITMLFHPRKRRPIFGQGLIPAQRDRVIERLAKAVSQELINEKIIRRRIEESGIVPKYRDQAVAVTHTILADQEFRADLKTHLVHYVNSVLSSEDMRRKIVDVTIALVKDITGPGIGGVAFKAYHYLNKDAFRRKIDDAVRELPQNMDIVLDELDNVLDRIPDRIAEQSTDIEELVSKIILRFIGTLDMYSMIIANMRNYNELQLEALIRNSSNEQLNYIKYLGGVLGMVGGLVITQPLVAVGLLGAGFAGLVVLDVAIMRVLWRDETQAASPV